MLRSQPDWNCLPAATPPSSLGPRPYDVSPDSRRFLVLKDVPASDAADGPQITVVLNWFEDLKRLVPVNGWRSVRQRPFEPNLEVEHEPRSENVEV